MSRGGVQSAASDAPNIGGLDFELLVNFLKASERRETDDDDIACVGVVETKKLKENAHGEKPATSFKRPGDGNTRGERPQSSKNAPEMTRMGASSGEKSGNAGQSRTPRRHGGETFGAKDAEKLGVSGDHRSRDGKEKRSENAIFEKHDAEEQARNREKLKRLYSAVAAVEGIDDHDSADELPNEQMHAASQKARRRAVGPQKSAADRSTDRNSESLAGVSSNATASSSAEGKNDAKDDSFSNFYDDLLHLMDARHPDKTHSGEKPTQDKRGNERRVRDEKHTSERESRGERHSEEKHKRDENRSGERSKRENRSGSTNKNQSGYTIDGDKSHEKLGCEPETGGANKNEMHTNERPKVDYNMVRQLLKAVDETSRNCETNAPSAQSKVPFEVRVVRRTADSAERCPEPKAPSSRNGSGSNANVTTNVQFNDAHSKLIEKIGDVFLEGCESEAERRGIKLQFEPSLTAVLSSLRGEVCGSLRSEVEGRAGHLSATVATSVASLLFDLLERKQLDAAVLAKVGTMMVRNGQLGMQMNDFVFGKLFGRRWQDELTADYKGATRADKMKSFETEFRRKVTLLSKDVASYEFQRHKLKIKRFDEFCDDMMKRLSSKLNFSLEDDECGNIRLTAESPPMIEKELCSHFTDLFRTVNRLEETLRQEMGVSKKQETGTSAAGDTRQNSDRAKPDETSSSRTHPQPTLPSVTSESDRHRDEPPPRVLSDAREPQHPRELQHPREPHHPREHQPSSDALELSSRRDEPQPPPKVPLNTRESRRDEPKSSSDNRDNHRGGVNDKRRSRERNDPKRAEKRRRSPVKSDADKTGRRRRSRSKERPRKRARSRSKERSSNKNDRHTGEKPSSHTKEKPIFAVHADTFPQETRTVRMTEAPATHTGEKSRELLKQGVPSSSVQSDVSLEDIYSELLSHGLLTPREKPKSIRVVDSREHKAASSVHDLLNDVYGVFQSEQSVSDQSSSKASRWDNSAPINPLDSARRDSDAAKSRREPVVTFVSGVRPNAVQKIEKSPKPVQSSWERQFLSVDSFLVEENNVAVDRAAASKSSSSGVRDGDRVSDKNKYGKSERSSRREQKSEQSSGNYGKSERSTGKYGKPERSTGRDPLPSRSKAGREPVPPQSKAGREPVPSRSEAADREKRDKSERTGSKNSDLEAHLLDFFRQLTENEQVPGSGSNVSGELPAASDSGRSEVHGNDRSSIDHLLGSHCKVSGNRDDTGKASGNFMFFS